MKKIPTLFERDGQRMTGIVHPDCRWVGEGGGMPTAKWDGTACLFAHGKLWKRHTVHKDDVWSIDWEPAQPEPESNGKWPGWLPVTDDADDKWHRTGLRRAGMLKDGQTYELVGPKINGNRHQLDRIMLVEHGLPVIKGDPRTFSEILEWLAQDHLYEGIVWHHSDGRMAKIKKRDFHIRW